MNRESKANGSRWHYDESRLALRLHRRGLSAAQIGEHIGRSDGAVRDHLRLRYNVRPHRLPNVVRKNRGLEYTPGGGRDIPYVNPATRALAPEVTAERARAYESPHNLNQLFLGDPLPGRSALDRRRHP